MSQSAAKWLLSYLTVGTASADLFPFVMVEGCTAKLTPFFTHRVLCHTPALPTLNVFNEVTPSNRTWMATMTLTFNGVLRVTNNTQCITAWCPLKECQRAKRERVKQQIWGVSSEPVLPTCSQFHWWEILALSCSAGSLLSPFLILPVAVSLHSPKQVWNLTPFLHHKLSS